MSRSKIIIEAWKMEHLKWIPSQGEFNTKRSSDHEEFNTKSIPHQKSLEYGNKKGPKEAHSIKSTYKHEDSSNQVHFTIDCNHMSVSILLTIRIKKSRKLWEYRTKKSHDRRISKHEKLIIKSIFKYEDLSSQARFKIAGNHMSVSILFTIPVNQEELKTMTI